MILAWLGTYKNKSFLVVPLRPLPAPGTLPVRGPARAGRARWRVRLSFAPWGRLIARYPAVAMIPRYVLAAGALALNLYSIGQLRAANYDSAVGGIGWAVSLVVLILAFLGHNPAPKRSADVDRAGVEERTDWRIPRKLEIAIFIAILLLAFGMRFYRLDDWTTGMHGDEGEAGMDATAILEALRQPNGHPVSPFQTGWFGQPNFYYWGIALSMQVFGQGMGGLRMFSMVAGTLMVVPFYPLVRQWFGVRAAIIASIFLAISDVAIHFSRQEFSNITTPLFLVTGFFFLFRGLADRRLTNFVLAGYAHMLSMYFYMGGRLTPFMLAAVAGYLFLLMPLVRLPGVYREFRQRLPAIGRLRALGRAVRREARGVWLYANQIIVFAIACFIFASPWLFFFIDHAATLNSRTNDKLIFNNSDRMVQQYGVTHDPLYLGVRMPTADDVFPVPLVFEKTPISIQLVPDGFWPQSIWHQLTTTLSILTYRADASSVYTFTGEPVAKPIEAVLIILGIAWALWRWRDTRMAVLSIWFWSTIIVGGALTIDAPYMARIIGAVPTFAVFAAIPLSKLLAELTNVVGRFGRSVPLARTGQVLGLAALAALLGFLTVKNFTDYYILYMSPYPFPEVTGQAYFVRQMNQEVTSEGRPLPRYYDLGAHLIYWGHGDNRFLNHGTPGSDMVNAANDLPVIENGDRDVVFMVWDVDQQYLNTIKTYYPDGIEEQFNYAPGGNGGRLFTAYRVKKEQLDARRVLLATYTPASGPAIERQEPNLGTAGPPPAGLSYPVQAKWTGNLMAPTFGRYRLALQSTGPARLVIDGTPVLTTGVGTAQPEHEVILARGLHDIELTGTLASATSRVTVTWQAGGSEPAPIQRKFLWSGPGRALDGEIRPMSGDPFGDLPEDTPAPNTPPVTGRRVDGFLGFRDAPSALSGGGTLIGDWSGTLTVKDAGNYQFEIFSNGDSTVMIDGQLVVDNRKGNGTAHAGQGQIMLTPGPHSYEVRYVWAGGTGYLEAYWQPPGQPKTILGPDNLHADGGIWEPGTITEPGNAQIEVAEAPPVVAPERVVEVRSEVKAPRGLAVDKDGNIYVADTEHQRVAVFDKDGKLIHAWGKQGKDPGDFVAPEDIEVGPDGRVYVLDSTLSRIQVFTPDGQLLGTVGKGGWCSPAGFTVAPDGMVYVADTCTNRILKYTPAGESKAEYTGGSDANARFNQPVDVAVGPDGTIYVADLGQRVVKVDPTSGVITRIWPVQIGGGRGAANLAFSGGLLYLTDPDRNTVDVLDPATGHVTKSGTAGPDPGQFSVPVGIAAGPDGRIYVMDSENGRVQVFNKLHP
jgi:sugar lactone lactonase YvrE